MRACCLCFYRCFVGRNQMSSPDITIRHRNLSSAAYQRKNVVQPVNELMLIVGLSNTGKGEHKTWVHSLPSNQTGKAKNEWPNCPTDRGDYPAGSL